MKIEEVRYKSGTIFPYLGKEYPLEVRKYLSYQKPGVKLLPDRLIIFTAREEEAVLKQALREWYLQMAKLVIPKRVEHFKSLLKEEVGQIRIKDVKSRWGSCSSKRNLNFNWRLVMAPMEVLDYVVIHELCHLKEMNHSKQFWELVEQVMPDYRSSRRWLRECGLIETYL